MDSRVTAVISPGMDVPDFTMDTYEPSTSAFGRISLAQLRQQGLWTGLVFYPADFTFVCPTELADIADHLDEIQALGVKVISVSADTKYAHLAWRNSEKLLQNVRFSMGAEPAGGVSKLFGAYDEATGLTRRGTLIISPAGQLVSAEIISLNLGRDARELLRKFKAITYLALHPNEACPSKWCPANRHSSPQRRWSATSSRRSPKPIDAHSGRHFFHLFHALRKQPGPPKCRPPPRPSHAPAWGISCVAPGCISAATPPWRG